MKNETNDRVKRGHRTVRSTLTSLVALGATSVLLVGGLTLISASGASAATSSATSSAQCNATVTAGTGELVGALIAGVTAGTTKVTFDCNNAATPAIAAEVPLLATIGTLSVVPTSEADTGALGTFSPSSTDTGCPAATAGQCALAVFTVPAAFSATDTNAACPPTQAQINAGLFGCALAVATVADAPIAEYLLTYASQTIVPNAPTISATQTTGAPGSKIDVSDATGNTGYWWANAIQTNQATALGTTPMAAPSTCGSGGGYASVTSPFLFTNWFAAGSTTPITGSAAGVTISNDCYDGKTLYAPVLSGTITAPTTLVNGTAYTAYLCELNVTPYPSNDASSASHCGPAPTGSLGLIDASFTFTAAAGTISQNNPTSASVSATGSATFAGQLVTSGNSGAVTYTESTGSADLTVSASGAVSTTGALKAGSYTATGTTADPSSDKGTFTYTLNVTGATVGTPSGPKATRVNGYAVVGKARTLTITGSGFSGRPRITGHAGTTAVVTRATSKLLTVKVTVKAHTRSGAYTFTITEANGKKTSVRYSVRA